MQAALRDVAHEKSRVRRSALDDLARFRDGAERSAAMRACVQVLGKDPDPDLRARAAVCLADLEAGEMQDALLESTSDVHPRVRQMALLALGEVGSAQPRVTAALRRALDESGPALRFQAVIASGRLLPPGDLEGVVQRALNDHDPEVRHIGIRVAEETYAVRDEHPREAWDEVIGGDLPPVVFPRKVAEAIRGRLDDDDTRVAMAAAIALAAAGDESACDGLARLLNARVEHLDPQDECAAIRLCARLGIRSAIPGLQRRARRLLGSGVAWDARVALARLGDSSAQKRILRELGSWSHDRRMLAVAAAGQARMQMAIEPLRRLARRPGRLDVQAVEAALRLIEGVAEERAASD